MDYARPFKAVFGDPQWLKKMAITAVVAIVPILQLAMIGYILTYQRSVASGRDDVLPDWDDVGEYWMLGLKVTAAGVVFTLPVWLVGALLVGGSVLAAGGGDEALAGAFCGIIVFYLFLLVAAFVLGLMSMALLTHFNVHRTFGSFFKVGEVWRIVRANAGAYFGSLGMTWVLSFAVGMITTPITYGVSFAMVPALDSATTTEEIGAAVIGLIGLQTVVGVIMIIAYVPMYHLMFHYFGQYMGLAYGMRQNAPAVPSTPPAPGAAPDEIGAPEPVLPPPPPPGLS